ASGERTSGPYVLSPACTAAPRLPLRSVSDQTRAALQYVAKGHQQKSRSTLPSSTRPPKADLHRYEGNVRLGPLDFIQRHDRVAGMVPTCLDARRPRSVSAADLGDRRSFGDRLFWEHCNVSRPNTSRGIRP